jgi:hypothetical protein
LSYFKWSDEMANPPSKAPSTSKSTSASATTLPSTLSLDAVDRVGSQMERVLKLVGDQADKGVARFLQVVGGVFLLVGLIVRIVAAMSDKWPFPIRFTLGDYALTLGTGLLILIAGGGVKLYEFQVAMANYRATVNFGREREREAIKSVEAAIKGAKPPTVG